MGAERLAERRRPNPPGSSRPAAARWPPNEVRCDAQASRPASRSKPGMLRPDPRPPPSPSSEITIAGRWWRSARREATIPTTPGCQPSPATTSAGASRRSSGSSRSAASAAVSTSRSVARRSPLARLELGGDLRRPRRVLGEEELDPGVGAVEAPRRVDPRRQPEREVTLVELRRLARGRLEQGPDPGPPRPSDLLQAPPHDRPVLPDQRHDVGHRRQRDEIEIARSSSRRAEANFQATAVPQRSVKG